MYLKPTCVSCVEKVVSVQEKRWDGFLVGEWGGCGPPNVGLAESIKKIS